MFKDGEWKWFKKGESDEAIKTQSITGETTEISSSTKTVPEVPYKHTDSPVRAKEGYKTVEDIESHRADTKNPLDIMIDEEEAEPDRYAEYDAQGDKRPIQEGEGDVDDENVSSSEQEKRIWEQYEDELNKEIVDAGGYLNFIKPEELKKIYNSYRREREGNLKKLVELSKKRKIDEEEKQEKAKSAGVRDFYTMPKELNLEHKTSRLLNTEDAIPGPRRRMGRVVNRGQKQEYKDKLRIGNRKLREKTLNEEIEKAA